MTFTAMPGIARAFCIALVSSVFAVDALAADSSTVQGVTYAGPRVTPTKFDGDVRSLPSPRADRAPATKPYRPLLKPPQTAKVPLAGTIAPPAPEVAGPLAPMPSPAQSFAGLNHNDSCVGGQCGSGWPPDPNGDVGPNHYIQAVNTGYAIYSKTGTLLASFTEDQLWSVSGSNLCHGSSQGDPIVLYDALADRWILTHFAFGVDGSNNPVTPFYQCIAVSQTGDPVSGGWYFYPFRMDPGGAGQPPVGTFNDYGKFGIWTDCLYMAANGFNATTGSYAGAVYGSFSRSDLYSGAALTWSLGFINNPTDPFTMIPSNLSGKSGLAVP